MDGRAKAWLEWNSPEEKHDQMVDRLCVGELKNVLVYVDLLKVGLDLSWFV